MKSIPRLVFLTLLMLALAVAALPILNFSGTHTSAQSATKRYVIIYHQQSSIPKNADSKIASMGGTVSARLPEIGVLVATSNNPNFASEVANADASISDVAEDVPMKMIPPHEKPKALNVPNAQGQVQPPGDDTQTGPPGETLYPLQWDKKRMRASNQGSYSVQTGRKDVVVAVLDTGAQILIGTTPAPHPDIDQNLDYGRSRSFFPVQPNPDGDPNPVAWDDRNGHGSHCLSAVGAPINNFGMVGVAPNVTLVALKVLGDDGSGSYVSLAQALIYAGVHKFDVASMSLGGYLQHRDPSTKVLIKLVQRAVNFARENGVTPVAALSNESFNISDGSFMDNFIVVPAELPGVIGVSATGYTNLKASYSNYGVGKTDISAPGGDFFVGAGTDESPFGGVVGAWAPDSTELPGALYALASGTSMATPNAAGVCALIISQYGDFSPNGNSKKSHMSPQAVEAILQQTANNQPCPEPNIVNYTDIFGDPVTGVEPNQRCQGGDGYNNFYGKGIVDAFKAVTEGH
jgi:subtilisin family serine protease